MASHKLMMKISRARERKDFTDFELECESCTIPVHKIILCSQSELFSRVCNGKYQESEIGVYRMIDDSLTMVQRMVDYFYTGDYNDEPSSKAEDGLSSLQVNARMFALADKYFVDDLMVLAAAKYAKALQDDPDCRRFLASVEDVFTLTPDSVKLLRNKAVDFARRYVEKGTWDADFGSLYDQVALENPGFVKGLLDSIIRKPLTEKCTKCGPTKQIQTKQRRAEYDFNEMVVNAVLILFRGV
ncbi:uncharacterized protein BCR38DRAFT_406256 [Pseudomassariella vexata]|uniref:BTB domain-containing protein n=1 Tax=Pseudomassariella vexata TaxID=1141098 RepID=A0A1Y2E9R2_9PEZI|nr:uncharacterized protein BCR38DRAFT_406256 [Pseudomassariella vexata]ORY68320.1 hypothetical protein BCR38DRAFT_406256 [Pseudomassariella vexata]